MDFAVEGDFGDRLKIRHLVVAVARNHVEAKAFVASVCVYRAKLNPRNRILWVSGFAIRHGLSFGRRLGPIRFWSQNHAAWPNDKSPPR